MIRIAGWDIGGANVKTAWVALEGGKLLEACTASQPFEIWKDKDRLPAVLRETLARAGRGRAVDAMAITMTAELADIFATRREGVLFVLASLQAAFQGANLYAFSLAGEFASADQAQKSPLDFSAANWLASALWLAREFPNCLLVDTGSTTTDLIPILDGRVLADGRTDLERLASGELIYTGALRTNLAAIVQTVPVGGRVCRVASEYFAIRGDVGLILGQLQPEGYTCPTPDGKPASVRGAQGRLARLVCADVEMLSPEQIREMAADIHRQQTSQICAGINQILSRLPRLRDCPAVVLGSGAFLAAEAARQSGLAVHPWMEDGDPLGAERVPCLAAACLLAETLEKAA